MITAEQIVRHLALQSADVTALVGARWYADFAPQSPTAPYVLSGRVESMHQNVMSGGFGMVDTTLTIAVYDETKAGALDLAEKARLALHGFQGSVAVDLESVTVETLLLIREERDAIPPSAADEEPMYRVLQEYQVSHDVPIASP